jgi:hypothetical protein
MKTELAGPQWMDRPSTPGMWLCVPSKGNTFKQIVVCDLDQSDIDRGAPFHTSRVYGPIPARQPGEQVTMTATANSMDLIETFARRIYVRWDAWEADAGELGQAAQDSDVEHEHMVKLISEELTAFSARVIEARNSKGAADA